MKKFSNKNIVISTFAIILYFIWIHFLEYTLQGEIITNISKMLILLIIPITVFILIKEYIKTKKIDYKKIIIAIIVIGILLRTIYISYTDISERQHDVDGGRGHLAYIETIYETGELPQDNEWQFYQQPLHHLISSGWLKMNNALGVDLDEAKEGIQNLTAIYSSVIMLITYCILKELKIKDVYKILVLTIIAVHPTFIILSGSINNDILMTMFLFLSILYLIKWNKRPNYKNIIILALITACIALTKISGTIVAIPMIYIFLNKFIEDFSKAENKRNIAINYIIKFSVFGVIALGLGLSYSIRNMILFGQSIFYVPPPNMKLYCGDKSWFARLNIFSKELLENTYCDTYTDYNIPAFIIKCSLFGEYKLSYHVNQNMSKLLIIANCMLILISLISFVATICKYKKIKKKSKVYLNIFNSLYISQVFMYFYGNITMPFGCTMDFRYIVPTILIGMMFIVINMINLKKDKNYSLKCNIIYISVIVFAILSIVFEISYMRFLT